jgi:hypothetical protein
MSCPRKLVRTDSIGAATTGKKEGHRHGDGGGAGSHVDGVRRHHCYLASRWFRAGGGGSNE